MLIIGLTGSIATGKSTVSSLLSAPPYSLPVIDADVLAREVVEPGTLGYRRIVAYFGSTTPDLLVPSSDDMPEAGLTGKGRPLNRPALGRRVFGTSEQALKDRAVLNSIVHPAVRRAIYTSIARCYLRGCRAVVLDVPLLFESRLDVFCGVVFVVGISDPERQVARLRLRDSHLTEEDARARVKSQGDVRVKARRCEARGQGRGYVVWNDGTREELSAKVKGAVTDVWQRNPVWWSWLLLLCPPLGGLAAGWALWRNYLVNNKWMTEENAKAKL